MKILYVVHQFLPTSVAGTEVYTYKLVRELRERHEICLLHTELDATRPQYEVDETSYDGIPVTRMVYNYRTTTFEDEYRDPAAEQVFLDVLDREKPDIVHVQHLQAWSLGIPLLARARGIPLVYTLHEYALICPAGGQMILGNLERCDGPGTEPCADCIRERPIRSAEALGAPAGREPQHEIEHRTRAVLEMADCVSLFISPSRFLRERFLDQGFPADRFLASDNGFDVEAFSGLEREPCDRIRFAYVGAMVPYKGVHVAVDAFNELAGEGWEFHVYGGVRPESPHFPYLEEIRRRAEHPRIHVHGAFRPDAVAEVYRNVDVLVVPSLWVENSPLTIHEAFVCGAPVLTSNLGGMAELVEDGVSGLRFAPGDAGALRAAARRILEEGGLLDRLRAGIPDVKAMPEHAIELESLYREVRVRPWADAEVDRARAARVIAELPQRADARRATVRHMEAPAANAAFDASSPDREAPREPGPPGSAAEPSEVAGRGNWLTRWFRRGARRGGRS